MIIINCMSTGKLSQKQMDVKCPKFVKLYRN